jgi:pyruvate kinase
VIQPRLHWTGNYVMADSTNTKIIATIGPASSSGDVLAPLIDAGADLIRFNLSHSRGEERQKMLEAVRNVVRERATFVGLLADLPGPKVRVEEIDTKHAELVSGAECRIARGVSQGHAAEFSVNYASVIDDVQIGHRVLIDDGAIHLRVSEKGSDWLNCVCEVGGHLDSYKGVNLPDTTTSLPALGEADRAGVIWAVHNDFDYLAMSFVRCAEDLHQLRLLLEEQEADLAIVAKIETRHALENLDEIVEAADAVLVARGDLGVEIDVWRIPMLQKRIVRCCHEHGKPVIIATQMLQSMVENATPTRAEVGDVANAVFERADAVMLSAESSVGRYPVASVRMLENVSRQAENDQRETPPSPMEALGTTGQLQHDVDRRAAAVARSATLIGRDLGAKLLAVWCRSGRTARWVSKSDPGTPIIALCSRPALCRRMALVRGIKPVLLEPRFADGTAPWSELEGHLCEACALQREDIVVVVGDPVHPERVSTLSIEVVSRE